MMTIEETGQAPEQAEDTAPAVEEPTPEQPVQDADADADEQSELSADELRSEVERARNQAAKYRKRLRAVEAEFAAFREQNEQQTPAQPDPAQEAEARIAAAERRAQLVELAAEHNIPSAALRAFRALDAAETTDDMTAALEALRSHLAAGSGGPAKPPGEHGRQMTTEEQISEAERTGDVKTAMRLKSARLVELSQQRRQQ